MVTRYHGYWYVTSQLLPFVVTGTNPFRRDDRGRTALPQAKFSEGPSSNCHEWHTNDCESGEVVGDVPRLPDQDARGRRWKAARCDAASVSLVPCDRGAVAHARAAGQGCPQDRAEQMIDFRRALSALAR